MSKPCYHCHSSEAAPGSNFCAGCSRDSRPLFFPKAGRKRDVALTALFYTGALAALCYATYKGVELWLQP